MDSHVFSRLALVPRSAERVVVERDTLLLQIRSRYDEEVMMRVVFVHGACVKDGSWWWHRTGELLAERGVASQAPALPSCGETGEPTGAGGPGLAEDVAALRQVLTANDEPTVVVAHSYGGIVTPGPGAGSVVELDAGHHPFLSQPAAVRELILGL